MTNQISNTRLQTVDSATLKQWLDHNQVILIDVREPSEYAAERIDGARLVPLSKLDINQIPFGGDKDIVLQCQTGIRSGQAAQQLLNSGIETVTHLEGGLNVWKQRGYPTRIDRNAPISINRQVQITAGTLVVVGTILGAFVSPSFLIISGFVGAGLVFSGITNTCVMGTLLAKLPYNQVR
ncbi:MAG: rhodanese-like domain-containing protein [Pseudanabaena sp.]|jgi:rhodanese-related sulfurtransferase